MLDTRLAYDRGVEALGFRVFGGPELGILAFGAPDRDIAAIGQGMTRRGWLTGHVKNPAGLHLMLNLTHEPVVGEYLADLAASLQEAGSASGGSVSKAVY